METKTEVKKLDFQKLIDDTVVRRERKIDKNSIHVSSLGQCKRKVWYKYFIQHEFSIDTLRIFKIGDKIHEWTTELLEKVKAEHGIQYMDSEMAVVVMVEEGDRLLRFSGKYDEFLVLDDGTRMIIEKKSTKSVDAKYRAEEDHIMQAMVYMAAKGAEKGMIVYFSKTDMKVKQFAVEFDKDIYNKAITRGKEILQHVHDETLPEPESFMDSGKSWMCKSKKFQCPFLEECFNNSKVAITDETERRRANRNFWRRTDWQRKKKEVVGSTLTPL